MDRAPTTTFFPSKTFLMPSVYKIQYTTEDFFFICIPPDLNLAPCQMMFDNPTYNSYRQDMEHLTKQWIKYHIKFGIHVTKS